MMNNTFKLAIGLMMFIMTFTSCENNEEIAEDSLSSANNEAIVPKQDVENFLEENDIKDYNRFVFEDRFFDLNEPLSVKDFEYIKKSYQTAPDKVLHDDDGEKSVFVVFKEGLTPNELQDYIENRKYKGNYAKHSPSFASKKPYRYTFWFSGKEHRGGKGKTIYSYWKKTRDVTCDYTDAYTKRSFNGDSDKLSSIYLDCRRVQKGTGCTGKLFVRLELFDDSNFGHSLHKFGFRPNAPSTSWQFGEWISLTDDVDGPFFKRTNDRANSVIVQAKVN